MSSSNFFVLLLFLVASSCNANEWDEIKTCLDNNESPLVDTGYIKPIGYFRAFGEGFGSEEHVAKGLDLYWGSPVILGYAKTIDKVDLGDGKGEQLHDIFIVKFKYCVVANIAQNLDSGYTVSFSNPYDFKYDYQLLIRDKEDGKLKFYTYYPRYQSIREPGGFQNVSFEIDRNIHKFSKQLKDRLSYLDREGFLRKIKEKQDSDGKTATLTSPTNLLLNN